MRKNLLFFLLLPYFSFSQNLLVNSGFEEENMCIEYNVNCAPEGWIYTAPSFIYYFKDAKLAHSGGHFIAVVAGHSKKNYFRNYVRSKLVCGLRKGKTYRLQFFIKSVHPILDSIGVYFSNHDFLFEKRAYRNIVPSIYLADASTEVNSRDTSWQKVAIEYIATGQEAFITLGNFRKQDITGSTGITHENHFFVLFDDISLTPLDPNEKLCSDWRKNTEDIYEQNERHEYLDRLIRFYRNKPQEPVRLPSTIVQRIDTVIVPDILFETGKYNLTPLSYKFLDSVQTIIGSKHLDSISIEGHTDNTGTEEKNRLLGYNRALTVTDYLKSKNTNTVFVLKSWSSSRPVADNTTAHGRQRNRRVEIYFYIRE